MRLLVVRLSDVGDALLATPALRAVRESFPAAHITALLAPPAAALLCRTSLVDEIVAFDKYRFDSPHGLLNPRALADTVALLRRLRRGRFDAVVLLHHLSTRWGARKFALLSRATGARRLIGLDNGRGGFLTESLPDDGFGARHEVEYALEVVRLLGASTDDWRLELPVSSEDEAKAASLLAPGAGHPLIALHPGSGWYSPARRWPVERFATVAAILAAAREAVFVLLGGPEEATLTHRLGEAIAGQTIDLAGKTTIGELAAVLRRCSLLVGNDSGVMHVATAVGCPTVAIFGPSNHRAWGPWTKTGPHANEDATRAVVIRAALSCSPCLYVGKGLGQRYGCPALTCLTSLTAESVGEAAERMLRAHEREALHSRNQSR